MNDSEFAQLKENTNEEDMDLLSTSKSKDSHQELINWKVEAQKGNFMPSILQLEKREIGINDIVVLEKKETLLHLSIYYGLYNVIKTFIEVFKADINSLDWFDQSPLHIICNNQEHNIYILSYLLKNEKINISLRNKGGLTPIFYSVINNFHFAFLSLIHLNHDLNQSDSNQNNNLLYFALVNNNRFAVDIILNNCHPNSVTQLINNKYYNNSSCLSDILITSKNNEITKYLLKYYNKNISFDSIASCKKNKFSFPFYNEFTYELFNTLYFYKCGHYFRFIIALIFNGINNHITSNYILKTPFESNSNVSYRFKSYMVKFMVFNLILQNMAPFLKVILFSVFLIQLMLLNFLLGKFSLLIIILYSLVLMTFSILSKSNKSNKIEKGDYCSLAESIHNILVDNLLQLPSIIEICPKCSIRKNEKYNHCNICDCCIKDFYFHSTLFNFCINRKNVRWYILFLIFLMILFVNIAYQGEYDILQEQTFLFIKITKIITKSSIAKLLIESFLIILGIICLGKALVLIICLGMNVSYYNMFRYHKRELGLIKERNKLYFQIPEVYFASICQFLKNVII